VTSTNKPLNRQAEVASLKHRIALLTKHIRTGAPAIIVNQWDLSRAKLQEALKILEKQL
jgi:nicotinic acid mononucleotide adenylyltransferase